MIDGFQSIFGEMGADAGRNAIGYQQSHIIRQYSSPDVNRSSMAQ